MRPKFHNSKLPTNMSKIIMINNICLLSHHQRAIKHWNRIKLKENYFVCQAISVVRYEKHPRRSFGSTSNVSADGTNFPKRNMHIYIYWAARYKTCECRHFSQKFSCPFAVTATMCAKEDYMLRLFASNIDQSARCRVNGNSHSLSTISRYKNRTSFTEPRIYISTAIVSDVRCSFLILQSNLNNSKMCRWHRIVIRRSFPHMHREHIYIIYAMHTRLYCCRLRDGSIINTVWSASNILAQ